jgi:hypothetical protein
MKISDHVDEIEHEPQVLIVGAHHAREWMSFEVPMYLIHYLLENYGNDPRVTWLVDNREFWIVPMLNPDGVAYMQTEGVSWRKNLRDNDGDASTPADNQNGVDLNRNYPFHWGEFGGDSRIPTSSIYRGPKDNEDDDGDSQLYPPGLRWLKIDEDPVDNLDNDEDTLIDEDPDGGFSEPETCAMRDLVVENKFTVALSFHSAAEKIIYPWGYTEEPTQDDFTFKAIGKRLVDFTGYELIQGYHWYKTCGDFDDWVYGKHSIITYTIEIGKEFQEPEERIIPLCELNLKPCMFLAQVACKPRYAGELVAPGPLLRVIPLENTSAPGPYVLKTQINPESPVDLTQLKLTLYYRTADDKGYISVPMYRVLDGYEFTGVIPVQYERTTITYFVLAEYDGNLFIAPNPVDTYIVEIRIKPPTWASGKELWLTIAMVILFCGIAWGGFTYCIKLAMAADRRKALME